ncbi:DDE-type integrase/transposase/recombinase [Streptomyces sp. NPDC004237]|uniref:DDE-type integrase/transposase/recombinase n=1 Tax=Streptomyces sp. NPDC004237 TaxID=3154455 RepID=UPI0033BDD27E
MRRDVTAEQSDLTWASELTEIETDEGKLYLATIIGLFPRRVLGYAMIERHDPDLLVASLNMATATRGGDVRGVITHTDRGSEDGSIGRRSRILLRQRRERGVQQRPDSRVRKPPHLPHPH